MLYTNIFLGLKKFSCFAHAVYKHVLYFGFIHCLKYCNTSAGGPKVDDEFFSAVLGLSFDVCDFHSN